MARRRMAVFVITIFVAACVIAGVYLVGFHPAQTDQNVAPLQTSQNPS